jgi:membrane protease YdiL (CAAX protease family)
MRKIFQTYPNFLRLLLGAILIIAALILSGLVPDFSFLAYFPFVGLVLICIATWVAFRSENKTLSALGFDLQPHNMRFLPFGLLLGLVAFVIGFCLKTFLTGKRLHFNTKVNFYVILKQVYWVLPTAAVQEFICRGYCFKKLIEMSNVTIANLIMGLVFVSMHDVFGLNLISAITYTLFLFLGHLVHSTALIKSGTIYFPIGIHWGNNLASLFLFTNRQDSTSILFTTQSIVQNPGQQEGPLWGLALYLLVFNIGFILLTLIVWKWRTKPAVLPTAVS